MLMVVLTYNLLHPLNVVEGVRRLALVHVVEEGDGVEVEEDLPGLDVVAVARLLQQPLTNGSGNLLVISHLLSTIWMNLMRIWVVALSRN